MTTKLTPRFTQVVNPRSLWAGALMVSTISGAITRLVGRKEDDTGWWCGSHGGGLADSAIASGMWVQLLGFTPEGS
jgi:hypothetical protein